MAEGIVACLVLGRIYSSQNIHPVLLSWFSGALCFLRGASPSFSFLPFLNRSLHYDHDLRQKGQKNPNPYQLLQSHYLLNKYMALLSFTRNCGIMAETFPLRKESHSMIQNLVLKCGNFSHRNRTCFYCSSDTTVYWPLSEKVNPNTSQDQTVYPFMACWYIWKSVNQWLEPFPPVTSEG